MKPTAMLCAVAAVLATAVTHAQTPSPMLAPAPHAVHAHAKPVAAASGDAGAMHMPAGRFGSAYVYIPAGRAKSVAIFISGDGGWELGVVNMALALRDLGAVVIGVDIRRYFDSLRKAASRPDAPCQLIAGDFETLSHQIQKNIGLTEYHVPVLVGYSSGATVAYATLVQAPTGTFAGALSLGFCADQDFAGAQLCPGAGLHYAQNAQHELVFEPATTLKQPWIAFQGEKDQVCNAHAADEFSQRVANGTIVKLPLVGHGFSVEHNWMPQYRAAYARLVPPAETATLRPAEISDLPVQEVHASGSSDEFALLLTGDGGWAGLDQELAARLAANGVPTVGLNSLKYFWSARTADETARDVTRVITHYLAAWHKQRVLLIGYSFGADVLPFVVNRLAPQLRQVLSSVSLLGIDSNASFEVRVADWVGGDNGGPATRPEVLALTHVPVLCIYGEGESDSICPALPAGGITREEIGKGHHFSGDYAALADRILAFARAPRPVT
jgi:type IV secretory pathway VirJ component